MRPVGISVCYARAQNTCPLQVLHLKYLYVLIELSTVHIKNAVVTLQREVPSIH